MKQILLVEDSPMFGRLAKKRIEAEFESVVYWAKTLSETRNILEKVGKGFTMALLDYNLPDAPNGEVLDEVVDKGISSIVFTSDMTVEVHDHVWSKKVVDYILKNDPNSLDYVVSAMKRMDNNENSIVLIVENSQDNKNMLSELLYIQHYRVLTAANGEDGLSIIEQYPEIKLVISAFKLPGIDGCVFCQKIREFHKKEDMAFIGISSENDPMTTARFIKSGANDFIFHQTFLVEEFYSRVNQCIDTIDLIRKIRRGG